MSLTVDLSGRTALVTGASSGLGRHFATILARSGARVVCTARRADALAETCETIRQAGGTAEAATMDVTDATSVRDAVARAGAVDILVNNAGIAITKPFLDVEPDEWDRVVDTNLRGAFLVAQASARSMRDGRREGSIVNVASILGLRVGGQVPAYVASKAGLVHLTGAMALELARYGIRVNALCPGYTETDINRDFFATETGQAMIRRIPQRRLGRLSDLDGALLLLCSDASAFMTGAAIPVDGGHLVSTL